MHINNKRKQFRKARNFGSHPRKRSNTQIHPDYTVPSENPCDKVEKSREIPWKLFKERAVNVPGQFSESDPAKKTVMLHVPSENLFDSRNSPAEKAPGPSLSTIWWHKEKQKQQEKEATERFATKAAKNDIEMDWTNLVMEEVERWPRVKLEVKEEILKSSMQSKIGFKRLLVCSLYEIRIKDLACALKLKSSCSKIYSELTHYLQVLQFMNWQVKCPNLPRKEAAINVAIGFSKSQFLSWGRKSNRFRPE